ncbi:CocE/NonD family hydrolase [Variovorax sp. J22R24]|uniref:CocE/NonD family hydrolase n=1 Tax=Variovorax gracilis TaxID=3053502 RepID=UPI002574F76A|nr:CocE/NonD family hydrolase [Variovorax sp. J22R24]MDM0107696.1 CocE/NonD family hydrolase [Variovorax sp. J22R24]
MNLPPDTCHGHAELASSVALTCGDRSGKPVVLQALAGLVFCAAGLAHGQSAPDVTCHIEYATTRDGVRLATEVYLPLAAGRYPVVMQRTPYNRNGAPADVSCANTALQTYARNGYAALNQDVRGLYRSDGIFDAMRQEANDGYDAIEWAARQPWSTGKVGTFSGSYVGLTQWQPAIQTPPSLAAISPNITASDYHDHWTYVNGAFALWFAQSWIPLTLGKETMLRQLLASGMSREEANAQVAAFTERSNRELTSNWVWQLPLKAFPEFRSIAPYYYEWLDHPDYDAYWQALDVEPRYQNVRVPTLNSGAWYDIFQVGTVRNFQGMRANGGTAEAREGSKLIMTCCGHAGTSGQVSWGTASPPITTELRFFDRYLKGISNGVERDPAVQLYVLNPPDTGTQGSGFWVHADQYPLPGTRNTTYFFTSAGRANSSAGDGKLDSTPPWEDSASNGGRRRLLEELRSSIPDQFVYHPNDPVPTVGGNLCCQPQLLAAGAHDQTRVEARNDVLVYTSEPLAEDMAVIGPVKVVLWAASSARDTDFTAKLVDVHLDGFAHNVLDRLVRARFREGSKSPPSLIRPLTPYEYTIELGNAGTVFKKGHRIRVEISSSNFPQFARNLNTGLDDSESVLSVSALQVVLHDRHHTSRLELPVATTVRIPSP